MNHSFNYLVNEWIPLRVHTNIVSEDPLLIEKFCLSLIKSVLDGNNFLNRRVSKITGKVLWCTTNKDSNYDVHEVTNKLGIDSTKLVLTNTGKLLKIGLQNEDDIKRIKTIITHEEVDLVIVDVVEIPNKDSSNMYDGMRELNGLATISGKAIISTRLIKREDKRNEINMRNIEGDDSLIYLVKNIIALNLLNNEGLYKVNIIKENLGNDPKPVYCTITDKGLEFTES